MRYLCSLEKKNQTLYSPLPKARALVDMWADYTNKHIGLAATHLAWQKVWKPRHGLLENPECTGQALDKIKFFLGVVEKQLSRQEYLATDHETSPDLSFYPQAHCLDLVGFDLQAYPALISWMERVRADSVNATLEI